MLKVPTRFVADTVKPVVFSLVRPVGLLALLVTILWSAQRALPDTSMLTSLAGNWMAAYPTTFLLMFVIVGMLLTAVGLSRQALAALGGYIWGYVIGSVVTLIAVMAGSVITYHVAARVGRHRLQRRYPQLIATLDSWTAEHVFVKTLALRLFPVGSNVLTNMAAGITHTRRMPFFSASLLGFIPQTAIFALTGSGASTSSLQQILLALGLLIVSILVSLRFSTSLRTRRV